MARQNEIELLQDLAKGDAIAFSKLVSTYRKRLLHFSEHYLNDHEMAKDVVQDVFIDVWDKYSKFSEVKCLSSWLFTLTKNHCLKKIDHFKVQQKYTDLLLYRQLQINQDSLQKLDTSPIIFNEIIGIVQQTLDQLPMQTRQVFEMSRMESKKNREIAEELGISIKTVEAAITKTLKILRPVLQQYLPIFIF